MKGKDENNVSMKMAVESILTKYQNDWLGVPVFADAVIDFRAGLSQIDNQRKVQEIHTKGAADVKTANRMVMCDDAIVVAKVVKTYAKIHNDLNLIEVVNYSYTSLFKGRDTDSKVKCNDIYDVALPIEQDLINNYGLNAMALPNLNSAITAYNDVIVAPIKAKGVKKTAGKNITKLIKETDDTMKNIIDNLMETFKVALPDFYKEYQNARMIIDSGTRKKPAVSVIKGITLNFETDKPEGAVKVWLEDGSSETLSTAAGEYKLPVHKEGTVTVIAEKAGFEIYEEDVDVVKGEDIEMNIDMEPKGSIEEVPPEEV